MDMHILMYCALITARPANMAKLVSEDSMGWWSYVLLQHGICRIKFNSGFSYLLGFQWKEPFQEKLVWSTCGELDERKV
jgi:hypothetical protein